MALSAEDLAQLDEYIKVQVDKGVEAKVSAAVAEATTPAPSTNDEPQNQPENQPDYYVWLANGKVIESKDSVSTHMEDPDSHEALVVVGRYPKGA